MDTTEILRELIKVSPAAVIAGLALYLNHKQIQIWAEKQEEISRVMGQVLEALRHLNGGKK